MPVNIKIELEHSEREETLRSLYGDPDEEWKQIENDFLRLQFENMKEEVLKKRK